MAALVRSALLDVQTFNTYLEGPDPRASGPFSFYSNVEIAR